MKPKGLLISAVLLAVLAGLVLWSNKRQNAPKPDTGAKMLSIPQDQLSEIRLKNLTGQVIVLRRENGSAWRMTEPQQLPADQDAVGGVITAFSDLTAEKIVEDKATDLHGFGLDIPTLEVTATTRDGKKRELLIGNSTLDTNSNYAKLADDQRVFTIAGSTKLSLDKTPEEMRDKRLLTFDQDSVSRILLQAKGQDIEFGKSGQNEWQILKPRPLRADNSQVTALLDTLREAKLDPTEMEQDAAKKFAAAPRVGSTSITDRSGTQTIEIRKDKEGDVFAKSSAIEGTWKTAPNVATAVDRNLDEFRNRKLFDFAFNDPSRVELKGAAYVKSGEKWFLNGKAMDSASVQSLIDKLRALSATKFPPTGGGAPVFEAAVTWNEGKRVERVTVAKQGSQYFARRENDPVIYEVDSKSVEELQQAAAGIKEAAPEPGKK